MLTIVTILECSPFGKDAEEAQPPPLMVCSNSWQKKAHRSAVAIVGDNGVS